MEISPDLNEIIDTYIHDFKIRNPTISVVRKGSVITSLRDNHEITYQEFKMIEQGTDIWGIISTWYCEETSRNFVLCIIIWMSIS